MITKGDCSDHLENLELTLQHIKYNGLKFNIEKSFFGQTEMKYPGFWVTRNGIRQINKKVEAIVNMDPPNNTKHVHEFTGLVK